MGETTYGRIDPPLKQGRNDPGRNDLAKRPMGETTRIQLKQLLTKVPSEIKSSLSNGRVLRKSKITRRLRLHNFQRLQTFHDGIDQLDTMSSEGTLQVRATSAQAHFLHS